MRTDSLVTRVMSLTMGLITVSCNDDLDSIPSDELSDPLVDSLSVSSAAVGEEIMIHGAGFIEPEIGYTQVTLSGSYLHDHIAEQVNLDVQTDFVDENTLIWRFGPYQIPFTPAGNHLGTFEGEIFATNVMYDERRQRQKAPHQRIRLDVEPSLVVLELTAAGYGFEADCNFVGTRVINSVPYRLTVEAVGFEASGFFYSVSSGLFAESGGSEGSTDYYHTASRNIDSLGVNEDLRFAEVPRGVPVYRASISAAALSTTGEQYNVFLMLTVHQPISVRYDGNVQPAELIEPVRVSGCNSGGSQGRHLTYSETVGETRTLSTSQTFTTGWESSSTEDHISTYSVGSSHLNRIEFSTSDQDHWSWNVWGEVMGGGEDGIPLVSNGKVELKTGGGRVWGRSLTDTRTGQQIWSEIADYTDAISITAQHEQIIAEAETANWRVSTTTSNLWEYTAFLHPNREGVWYRQTTRIIRRADIVALDLCGNETVVGEMVMNEYAWSADLGSGESCPPYPQSQLPHAVCFIPPCEEVLY